MAVFCVNDFCVDFFYCCFRLLNFGLVAYGAYCEKNVPFVDNVTFPKSRFLDEAVYCGFYFHAVNGLHVADASARNLVFADCDILYLNKCCPAGHLSLYYGGSR